MYCKVLYHNCFNMNFKNCNFYLQAREWLEVRETALRRKFRSSVRMYTIIQRQDWHLITFQLWIADFEGDAEMGRIQYFNMRYLSTLVKMMSWLAFGHVPLTRHGIFGQCLSKMAELEIILKSRLFPFSIVNRNALTLAALRGPSVSSVVLLSRYGIFLHFQPFQPVFSQNGWFWRLILKSRLFPFSIFITNVSTLVRMRGP